MTHTCGAVDIVVSVLLTHEAFVIIILCDLSDHTQALDENLKYVCIHVVKLSDALAFVIPYVTQRFFLFFSVSLSLNFPSPYIAPLSLYFFGRGTVYF